MKDYDDELANTQELMAEMLLDIRAACKGVRVEDSMYHCYDIDREEARETIVNAAENLCRCVREYAAYTKAYEDCLTPPPRLYTGIRSAGQQKGDAANMPGSYTCYFGKLTSVTRKSRFTAKDWKDHLIGAFGLIVVLVSCGNWQRIVCEICGSHGCVEITTDSGAVNIEEGRLIADTRSRIYEFELDTRSFSFDRAMCLREIFDKITFLLNSDEDRDHAERLLQILEQIRQAVSREFVSC